MKKPFASLRILAFALVMTLLAGDVHATSFYDLHDTVKKSFKVQAGGTLSVDIDRGEIEVESASGNTVYVEVERMVTGASREDAKRILERHDLQIFKQGDDVRIESSIESNDGGYWSRWKREDKFKVRIRVKVPDDYNIDFTSGAGNVEIAALTGRVEGRTGAGNIRIGDIRGPVDVHSGSGNVVVRSAVGSVEVHSGAGNVTIGDVEGDIRAHTGAGNIEARITRQPRGTSRLESGAGNVTVYLASDVSVDVDATAAVGSASCDFGLRVQGKWINKSFSGDINGGGPPLLMRSGVGNVSLKRL